MGRIVSIAKWIPMALLAAGVLACAATDALGGGSKTGPGYYDDADKLKTTVKDKLSIGGPAGTAKIDTYFDANNWTFDGTEGQDVTVTVTGVKDSDPHFKLIDPDGMVYAEDDDSGGGTTAEVSVTLPKTGTYTIRIDMMTLGDYTVSVH